MSSSVKIGNKIRKIRELRDLTQEYMANQLEISASAYQKIEHDECDAKWSRVCRIAQLLSVTPSRLIAFDCKNPFVSLDELLTSL